MDIQSPRTCICLGDIVKVECENNKGKIQSRFYFIEHKAELEGGSRYLAFRMKQEREGHFKLFSAPGTEGPIPVILDHHIGKDCKNTVTERYPNATLERGTRSGMRRLTAIHETARLFREAHASDKGPVIKCRNYGNLQVNATEDRRRREFLESVGHHGNYRSPEGTSHRATIGDAVGETLTQMSAEAPDDPGTSFEM